MSLQDMDIYNQHLVLSVNKNGFPMLCSVNLPINFNHKVLLFLLHYSVLLIFSLVKHKVLFI